MLYYKGKIFIDSNSKLIPIIVKEMHSGQTSVSLEGSDKCFDGDERVVVSIANSGQGMGRNFNGRCGRFATKRREICGVRGSRQTK